MGATDQGAGWIGTVLQNKWRIEAKIARGGVATVFRATHRQGQKAAIKIMHPQYARDADARTRFLREGYAANTVGHPSVVRVLDDDIAEDGSPYIVMELLEEGELLEDRRERLGGHLSVPEAVAICDRVLDVLAAAHEKGIIHRDIKPDNIYLLPDGKLKVLDFGIAHIKQQVLQREMTKTGLLLGTPEFMAPEQALGARGQIDPSTDIFSVGATLFTLVSGQAVHIAQTVGALLIAIATQQARSLMATKAPVPPELVSVVDRALALEKHRRWPSALAMQAALRAAVPDARRPDVETATKPTAAPMTEPHRRGPLPPLAPPPPRASSGPGTMAQPSTPANDELPPSSRTVVTKPPTTLPADTTPRPVYEVTTRLPPLPADAFDDEEAAVSTVRGDTRGSEQVATVPQRPTLAAPPTVVSPMPPTLNDPEVRAIPPRVDAPGPPLPYVPEPLNRLGTARLPPVPVNAIPTPAHEQRGWSSNRPPPPAPTTTPPPPFAARPLGAPLGTIPPPQVTDGFGGVKLAIAVLAVIFAVLFAIAAYLVLR